MYSKYHTSGIVLKSFNEGLDNKKLILFTRKFGCINVSVQSARSIHSKLRFNSQEFSFGNFSIIQGKYGWKLVGAKSSRNFFETFKNNDVKKNVMYKIFLFLRNILNGEEKNFKMFDSLKDFLFFIEKCEDEHIVFAEYIILLKILKYSGFLGETFFDEKLVFGSITEDNIRYVFENKKKVLKLINNSIHSAKINK